MSDGGASYERDEPEAQRLDRNWSELLQELRVTQTGVQLLAGFLLTLPFQSRFSELTEGDRRMFLLAFASAVASTSLLIAPVSAHRMFFRSRRKDFLVELADRCTQLGLGALVVTIAAVVYLIFGVVVGGSAGWIAAVVALAYFLVTWIVVPSRLGRRRLRRPPP